MTYNVIAYVNITTPESELMERIEITEEEWKSPLPRSILWMQIEEAINHIRKHRSETAQPKTLVDGLRQQLIDAGILSKPIQDEINQINQQRPPPFEEDSNDDK